MFQPETFPLDLAAAWDESLFACLHYFYTNSESIYLEILGW